MLKNLLTLAVSLIALGSISAQSFIGKLNPFPNQNATILADDTVKILAVMVNFQEDKDGATFGNGKFGSIYSQSYGNNILDPLPHDRDYFESHLSFVRNYYQKVSSGKVNVQFTILPDTFSVSKTMRNYSPIPGSDDFTPMGQYAQEVWAIADQMYQGLNFSEYNLFVIFHAGVGRDISLPGSIGNERDLPSVYLGENSLKNIFGDSFNGFPVSNGSFSIKNTMIIPETESRELETITGKYLFEITINGLLVASVASHLGLPDLFDTETGLSAIGRFGLMDGQSIFAYNGCFPPEPSAWEKIYLGWVEPTEISLENNAINLTANLAATLTDTVILKVPLNSSEYYLIENRQRDVSSDGANLTYKSGGTTINRTFPKDTTGFYSYDTDSLSGVVLDVDEFDWALPGNGIVIWHIDENVINEKLAENKINTDKTKRGVDVEEADGVQDIGEKFITIFGDEVIGEGTEQDFWYAGNKAQLFKNKFAKDTRPDTKTNSGANSLITIKDFSSNSNKMSFNIEYGDSVVKLLFTNNNFSSLTAKSITSIDSDNYLFAINSDSILIVTSGDSILQSIERFSDFKPASFRFGNISYLVGVKLNNPAQQFPSSIKFWWYDGNSFSSGITNLPYIISAGPVIARTLTENYEVLFGTEDGRILVYDYDSLLNRNSVPKKEVIVDEGAKIIQLAVNGSKVFAIGSKLDINNKYDLIYNDGSIIKFNDEKLLKSTSTVDAKGNAVTIISSQKSAEYFFYVTSEDKVLSAFTAPSFESASSFSLADLKNDGNNYLITNNGNKLFAYNFNGTLANNFPFELNDGDEFVGLPLAADIEGNLKSEIISFTKNGRVFAFDGGTGNLVEGFPISFGTQLISDAILFVAQDKIALAGIDSSKTFNGWKISSTLSRIDWAEIFGNNNNTSFLAKALETEKNNSFFPTNRAYNYPNPVYNGQTSIRYYVNEDSKINIKIFDLAGDYVAELIDDAQGGMDNETEWNVESIQSGVYLTRIEAVGVSGKTESVVIKIAVVK
jgi:hypothetical protein